MPLPTPNTQLQRQAGEAPAPTQLKWQSRSPKSLELQPALVSGSPAFWPGEEGSGVYSASSSCPTSDLTHWPADKLALFISYPSGHPSQQPKLGERPWAGFCPQTSAPPPPRARCYLPATSPWYLQLCPHRTEPPSSACLPAGLVLQGFCVGGAGGSLGSVNLSPPQSWEEAWGRVGGSPRVTKSLLCAWNPPSSTDESKVLTIKG